MLPSLRLAIYFGLGALLWMAAAANHNFMAVAALYDGVLIFVAAMDLLLSPRPREFDLQRQVEPKMNLGVPNPVTLRLRHRVQRPVQMTLRD